uniref:Uncharacterized protein n=1 Tax=Leersia perrieri TaxID=77586 RepID=A0A0D9XE73_9ORYZ
MLPDLCPAFRSLPQNLTRQEPPSRSSRIHLAYGKLRRRTFKTTFANMIVVHCMVLHFLQVQ